MIERQEINPFALHCTCIYCLSFWGEDLDSNGNPLNLKEHQFATKACYDCLKKKADKPKKDKIFPINKNTP